MFTKLLKNEWRASRKTIGLLCAVILISGLLIGSASLGLFYMAENTGSDALFVLLTILVVVCVVAVALSCAASVFYALWRFYRSRFTEEGYLTYTLPVNHHQLMLSGILVSVWDIFLTVLAAFVAVFLAMAVLPFPGGNWEGPTGSCCGPPWARHSMSWHPIWGRFWEFC